MLILEGLNVEASRVAFSADARAVLTCGQGPDGGGSAAIWSLPGRTTPQQRIDGVAEALFAPGGASVITLRLHPDRSATISHVDRATLAAVGEGRVVPPPGPGGIGEDCELMGLDEALRVLRLSGPLLTDLKLTPDGRHLVAVYRHRDLMRWSWPALTLVSEGGGGGVKGAFAFSPNGDLVAVLDLEGRAYLADERRGKIWETHVYIHDHRGRLAYSPDGHFVATASGTAVRVLDAAGGDVIARLGQGDRFFLDLAFTTDGRFLATVSKEGTVMFFNVASWRLEHELAWQVGGLRCLTFSRDGMLAAAGSQGGKVVVWDLDL